MSTCDIDFTYEDQVLNKLFKAMEPKQRAMAMRNTVKAVARDMTNTVKGNVKSGMRRAPASLTKGVRNRTFKKSIGFTVTLGEDRRTGKGFYASKHAKRDVPVLRWADTGTGDRFTRKKMYRFKGKQGWAMSRHRGQMKAGHFVRKAVDAKGPALTREMAMTFRTKIIETAKKYGCI